jgi:tRNA A-37 threonylcarbamoyl transferase component Bud32
MSIALGLVCLLLLSSIFGAAVVYGLVMLFRRSATGRSSQFENGDYAPSPIGLPAQQSAPGPLVTCPACGAEVAHDSPHGLCPRCLLQAALSEPGPTPDPGDPAETSAYSERTPAPAVADLAPLFPQLEIIELIGQGGMGAVYKARQIKLDRVVAVKVLPAEWSKDPAFAERFAREARALARLSHSQIVSVHDFGEAGGLFYLVMEFVDGTTLRQLLKRGPLEPAYALHIIPQICDALQYAHQEGVVHRDIKPENILLDKRGQVKIADFGLAKLMRRSEVDYTLTGTRQVMGTLDYMAPEQRTAPQEVDHRADIYSLGVVLYEMLTGELPLGLFGPPSAKAPLDKRFDAVVLRALEQEPDRRYQRVSEIKTAVEALARAAVPTVLPASHRQPANDDLAAELIQLRLNGPAAGLVITGLVLLIEGIFCLIYAIQLMKNYDMPILESMPGSGPLSPAFIALIGLVGVLLAAVIFAGARKLVRLESYGLVRAAIILAMLPFSYHCLLGFPVGLWALLVVTRRGVQTAFAMNAIRSRQSQKAAAPVRGGVGGAFGSMLSVFVHRPTTATAEYSPPSELEKPTPVHQAKDTGTQEPAVRKSGRRPWLAAIIIILGMVLAFSCISFPWLSELASNWTMNGPIKKDTRRADELTSLTFHRGNLDSTGLISRPELNQINDILRAADQDYLKIEHRYTKRVATNTVHADPVTRINYAKAVKVTVMPFVKELNELENRVWKQIETTLGEGNFRTDKARQLLAIRGSLFPFGTEEVTVELEEMWPQTTRGYRWRLTKPGDPGEGQWFTGPQLPAEYARFWEN